MKNHLNCETSPLKVEAQERPEKEVDRLISEGILLSCVEDIEAGVVPPITVIQARKNKV